jgi:malonate transporter and related proteins
MSLVLSGLIPVFLVMLMGLALARAGVVPAPMWVGVERLSYQVFLPALIIKSLVDVDFTRVPAWPLVIAFWIAIGTLTITVFALRRPVVGANGPAFGCMVQGSLRWNSYTALALSGAFLGAEGVSAAGIAIAAISPYLNVVSVLALTMNGTAPRPPAHKLALSIAINPFVWSTAAGLLLNFAGIRFSGAAAGTLALLAAPAIPLGLMVVGAGIDPAALLKPNRVIIVTALLKLIALPALLGVAAYALGLGPTYIFVAVLCGAVPTATASYLLARNLGGDAALMARIIATQTILSFVTMPLALSIALAMVGPIGR